MVGSAFLGGAALKDDGLGLGAEEDGAASFA